MSCTINIFILEFKMLPIFLQQIAHQKQVKDNFKKLIEVERNNSNLSLPLPYIIHTLKLNKGG